VSLEREAAFYEGKVVVRVEDARGTREAAEMTLRVVPGWKKSAQGQRVGVMHMEITREEDLFFLYTLQVSEEDFHTLKAEQSLLVDFAGFPPKFVELLENCRVQRDKDLHGGKFIAVLDLTELPVFKIVEANHFKQLTHLALRFQPGNDASVKSYLAGRLRDAQAEGREQQASIKELEEGIQVRDTTNSQLEEKVAKLELELSKCTEKLQSEFAEALSKQKENSLKLLSQTQNAAAEQARKQQEHSDRRISELEGQLSALQTEHRALYEEKASSESMQQQFRIKLESLEKFSTENMRELETLRTANKELDGAMYDLDRKLSEQQLTIATQKQQIEDKDDALNTTRVNLEQANKRVAALEDKMNHYKASVSKLQRKLELSIKEINKGNHVIENFNLELRELKDKYKRRGLSLKQQERFVDEKLDELQEATNTMAKLREQLENEKSQVANLKSALQNSKDKLEECNKMLEENQNVITFLHKEINDAQIGGRFSSIAPALHPSLTNFDFSSPVLQSSGNHQFRSTEASPSSPSSRANPANHAMDSESVNPNSNPNPAVFVQ